MVYRIGARTSPLALKQVEEVVVSLRKFYPEFTPLEIRHRRCLTAACGSLSLTGFNYEVVSIETYGDKDKTTPISDIEGTDFFTREIEEALLRGRINFAVHSAKDLPDELPKGLVIAAITKPIDPYDALVSRDNLRIEALRQGAKIGVSSQRRKTQLKKYRADFQVVDIRGNIEERLKKLDNNGFDAIVVAACALVRLGQELRISQRIPFEILQPHPLQGSLAIEVKKDNQKLIDLLKVLDGK